MMFWKLAVFPSSGKEVLKLVVCLDQTFVSYWAPTGNFLTYAPEDTSSPRMVTGK
jgi:hypothetical protein